MGTVTIGGRALRVLGPRDEGSMRVERQVIRAKAALLEAQKGDSSEAMQDAMVQIVVAYVGAPVNDGIDAAFLLEHLPADPSGLIRELILAAGGNAKEAAAQGEAVRP